jgi:hypothetical protein
VVSGSRQVKYWIVILVILLLVVNFVAFKVYQKSHWAPNVWEYLWHYGESAVFKVVTVSLILPILLLLLQTVFNIRGAIEERIEKERAAQHARRLKCISSSREVWNQLYDLTNEVRHFRQDSESGRTIHELIRQIGSDVNRDEDIVRDWRFELGLSEREEELFLVFINTLLNAAQTVAHGIAEKGNDPECEELMECLGVIQEGVKTVAHQQMFSVLTSRAELLRLEEVGGDSKREEALRRDMDDKLRSLIKWAELLMTEEITVNGVLATAQGTEVEGFRGQAEQLLGYLRDNPGKPSREFDGFKQFTDSLDSIPHRELLRGSKMQYSSQFVRHLAKWFARELTCVQLADTDEWQRKIGYASIAQPQEPSDAAGGELPTPESGAS